jgi:hypothetical protein
MLCDAVNQRKALRISTLFASAAAMKRDPHVARDSAGRVMMGEDGPGAPFPRALRLTLPRLLARRCPGKVRLVRRPRKLSPVASARGNSFRRTENRLGEDDCHETSAASIVVLAAGRPIVPHLTPRRGAKKRSITEGLPLISIGRGRREEKASIRSRMRPDAAV